MLSRRVATPLLDGLFLLLCWLLLLINPAQSENAKPIADYVLYIVWNSGVDVDLDVYVQGPDRKTSWYRSKDQGYMSIDRDDLGNQRDSGPINQEIVSFRSPPDGSYLVSLHNYRDARHLPGEVHLELVSRYGKTSWSATVRLPGANRELGVVEFVFHDDAFKQAFPSATLIRHASRG